MFFSRRQTAISDIKREGFLSHVEPRLVHSDLSCLPGATLDEVDDGQRSCIDGGECVPVPFFESTRVAFSIEWNALFNGAFVGEVARSSSYQEIASCTAVIAFARDGRQPASDRQPVACMKPLNSPGRTFCGGVAL